MAENQVRSPARPRAKFQELDELKFDFRQKKMPRIGALRTKAGQKKREKSFRETHAKFQKRRTLKFRD